VGLPNEAPPEESGPAQGHDRTNRPSPNRKRSSACLSETGLMAASANQGGNATGSSCSSVETDCGIDQEDLNPSSVTSSTTIRLDLDQEVAQEEVTTPNEIPSVWTLVKLEPDC
jgi:hypothetical protein